MNKGIKPRFWTALNRKWNRTEQEYETSANNFFACATWRSFLWQNKQNVKLNRNARQEERISHIWLIKRNFFVHCVGIQCRHLTKSQPPLLWPSKCHFDFSPFQDYLLLYLSEFNPDLARRPRNSVLVKHIYVCHSSSIAPKRHSDIPFKCQSAPSSCKSHNFSAKIFKFDKFSLPLRIISVYYGQSKINIVC